MSNWVHSAWWKYHVKNEGKEVHFITLKIWVNQEWSFEYHSQGPNTIHTHIFQQGGCDIRRAYNLKLKT